MHAEDITEENQISKLLPVERFLCIQKQTVLIFPQWFHFSLSLLGINHLAAANHQPHVVPPGFPLLWSLWHQFYPEYKVERSHSASRPPSQPGRDAAVALPPTRGRGPRWWLGWPGAVLGHRLTLWGVCKLAVKPWPDRGEVSIPLQPPHSEWWTVPGTRQGWAAPASDMVQSRPAVSVSQVPGTARGCCSLLGVEPGPGGRAAISLCQRTGCADLLNDGAYRLQHAVKIC